MAIPPSVEVLFAEPDRDYRVLGYVNSARCPGFGYAVVEIMIATARVLRADAILIEGRPRVQRLQRGPLRTYFLRWTLEMS
jgi:hypothetical protein